MIRDYDVLADVLVLFTVQYCERDSEGDSFLLHNISGVGKRKFRHT